MRLQDRLCVLMVAVVSLLTAGCFETDVDRANTSGLSSGWFGGPSLTVPVGTVIDVQLSQTLSSETAHAGEPWQGSVTIPVYVDGREVIPSGSVLNGVVVRAEKAQQGSRARLELRVTSVRIGDRQTSLSAYSDPVIAGSPRARNLGAIAGGAVAGALLGKATGNHAGTGAVLGGAIATGAVATSKGYQVVLPDGARMKFFVDHDVAVRA
jgi:hypothetical protein